MKKKKKADGRMMVIITVKEYSTASFYYPFTFYIRGERNNIGINLKTYLYEKNDAMNIALYCVK